MRVRFTVEIEMDLNPLHYEEGEDPIAFEVKQLTSGEVPLDEMFFEAELVSAKGEEIK